VEDLQEISQKVRGAANGTELSSTSRQQHRFLLNFVPVGDPRVLWTEKQHHKSTEFETFAPTLTICDRPPAPQLYSDSRTVRAGRRRVSSAGPACPIDQSIVVSAGGTGLGLADNRMLPGGIEIDVSVMECGNESNAIRRLLECLKRSPSCEKAHRPWHLT
jgi:hypothetical protein